MKSERLFAKHYYATQKYQDSTDRRERKEPKEPTIKTFKGSCLCRTRVEASPYYLEQIEDLNKTAEIEWDKIIEEKEKDDGIVLSSKKRISLGRVTSLISSIYKKRKFARGTAVVEFKTLAAVQSGETRKLIV